MAIPNKRHKANPNKEHSADKGENWQFGKMLTLGLTAGWGRGGRRETFCLLNLISFTKEQHMDIPRMIWGQM